MLLAAVRTLALSEAMGLLPEQTVEELAGPSFARVARAAGHAGIAPGAVARVVAAMKRPDDAAGAIEALNRALEASPLPRYEWRSLIGIFDVDELAGLLGVSVASARRYAAGSRDTPDDVAARLHFLALVLSDLRGAYNGIGIRRWFRRTRAALDGRSPAGVLGSGWQPEDDGAQHVRELARALVFSPAT